MTQVSEEAAEDLLERCVGPNAEFRPRQWEAIDRLVNDRERLLIVQRTGWGKSTVYFIATRLLRDEGAGPTLLVSPLLALMRNQILDAERDLDLRAETINSTNEDEWESIKRDVVAGRCDLLLVSPERLANAEFRSDVLDELEGGFGMLVVDEAHCISDWGHDFRPDYRRIEPLLQRLPEDVPVAATTATANDRVVEDVTDQLPGLEPLRGSLVRDSLRLQTIDLDGREHRLAWLAENLPDRSVAGIVYCLTIEDVETVSAWLNDHGFETRPYHGRLEDDRRREIEAELLDNALDAVVATHALGMGFNKPDLGFVVHFQRPSNLIRYYQEIGRAGRSLDTAPAILLSGREDDDIAEYFIETAFPDPDEFERVLSTIEDADGLYRYQLQKRVNITYRKIEKCLDVLRLEGAIERTDDGYERTGAAWSYDYERVERVTEQRWRELERIQEYVATDDCLGRFVDDELDGTLRGDCGLCANCVGDFLPNEVRDEGLVEEAIEHYRVHGRHEIEPRRRLPMEPDEQRAWASIPDEERLEPGYSLSIWDDPGWGRLVRTGTEEAARFDDRLVDAAAELIRDEWDPDPAPTWVTAVPSTSREGLVVDFATRLGGRLEIPVFETIEQVRETQPQVDMENWYQRFWNVRGAFEANGRVEPGPVLLVDDTVSSRWTLTEVGRVLRRAGSGPVYPFALAERSRAKQ